MNETTEKPVIVRLPPSPTGFVHVGNMRTLLFNHLFVKKMKGKTILRIEDTDRERSKPEYEEYLKEAFGWLGITWDEFYRQSERGDVYKKELERLIENGTIYVSEETPTEEEKERAEKYGKTLATSVIRIKNPNKKIEFHDEVFGDITIDSSELGDFIVAKNLNHPLYHFTVVVDDFLMGITHVIRGEDHLPNTAKHILIQEALGADRPKYIHLPLIVGADGKKLGKRHGATATLEFREKGYVRDAFVNFLTFVGWNPGKGEEKEIFSREELVEAFDVSGIQKSSAVFSYDKLNWFNREYLKQIPDKEFEAMILPEFKKIEGFNGEILKRLLGDIRERTTLLSDVAGFIKEGVFDYAFSDPTYDEPEKIVWKKSDAASGITHLGHVVGMIEAYTGAWEKDEIKEYIFPYADEVGRGDVLWPLRFSLSGMAKSPDPFTLLYILGKDSSLIRIKNAVVALKTIV